MTAPRDCLGHPAPPETAPRAERTDGSATQDAQPATQRAGAAEPERIPLNERCVRRHPTDDGLCQLRTGHESDHYYRDAFGREFSWPRAVFREAFDAALHEVEEAREAYALRAWKRGTGRAERDALQAAKERARAALWTLVEREATHA